MHWCLGLQLHDRITTNQVVLRNGFRLAIFFQFHRLLHVTPYHDASADLFSRCLWTNDSTQIQSIPPNSQCLGVQMQQASTHPALLEDTSSRYTTCSSTHLLLLFSCQFWPSLPPSSRSPSPSPHAVATSALVALPNAARPPTKYVPQFRSFLGQLSLISPLSICSPTHRMRRNSYFRPHPGR